MEKAFRYFIKEWFTEEYARLPTKDNDEFAQYTIYDLKNKNQEYKESLENDFISNPNPLEKYSNDQSRQFYPDKFSFCRELLNLLNSYLSTLSHDQLVNLKKDNLTNDEKQAKEEIVQLCKKVFEKSNFEQFLRFRLDFVTETMKAIKKINDHSLIHFENPDLIGEIYKLLTNPFLPKDLQLEFFKKYQDFVTKSIKDLFSYDDKDSFFPAKYFIENPKNLDVFRLSDNSLETIKSSSEEDFSFNIDDLKKDNQQKSKKETDEFYQLDPDVLQKIVNFQDSLKNGAIFEKVDFSSLGLFGSLLVKFVKNIHHANRNNNRLKRISLNTVFWISIPFLLYGYMIEDIVVKLSFFNFIFNLITFTSYIIKFYFLKF